MSAGDESQRWEFYLATRDNARASIRFNQAWTREFSGQVRGNHYKVSIPMLEPAAHGMGSAAEAERLNWPLDTLVQSFQDAGLYYVGRLRSSGLWMLSFYGEGSEDRRLTAGLAEVNGLLETAPDPDWHYFYDVLWPSDEEWHWIMDRRVTDQLVQRI